MLRSEAWAGARSKPAMSPGQVTRRWARKPNMMPGSVESFPKLACPEKRRHRLARAKRQTGEEVLPERFLHAPQVRGLAQEGRAMDMPQGGIERGPVPAEIAVDPAVGRKAEELAADLDGDHLAVAHPWRRPALAQARGVQHVAQPGVQGVVGQTVDCDEEGLEVHAVHGRLLLRAGLSWQTSSAAAALPWTSC